MNYCILLPILFSRQALAAPVACGVHLAAVVAAAPSLKMATRPGRSLADLHRRSSLFFCSFFLCNLPHTVVGSSRT